MRLSPLARICMASIVLSTLIPHFALGAELAGSVKTYTDLDPAHRFAEAIYEVTDKGWVNGYEDGSFHPDADVNRVEALKVLMQLKPEDAPALIQESLNFTDLNSDAWYMPTVTEAFGLGVISGYADGSFKPEQSVNRAEALKMLAKITQTRTLTPIEGEDWFYPYELLAEEKHLFTKASDGEIDLSQTLSRGELCDLIHRFLTEPFTGQTEYGKATYYGYSSNGVNTSSGKKLDAYGAMAAHKTLPFGTWVKVVNPDNNKSIKVEIVDRGPWGAGRIIDLTPSAFAALAPLGQGVAEVYIEVLK